MEDLSKDKSVTSGNHQAVVVGVSAGGVEVLKVLLALLPVDFILPVVIVQHLHPQQDRFFIGYLGQSCMLPVREAEEKEAVTPGAVYFAPPNYHLMIESDRTFSLSVDEKVNFSRPSIDVLFETAAEAYGSGLIGIILTGASKDGAVGLQRIKQHGGTAIVQDPQTAEFPAMPLAALRATEVDFVLNITQVGQLLAAIGRSAERRGPETGK
jgi:two-component system, chemotaxis family, protein-glutamate methylesterase/glutaminase